MGGIAERSPEHSLSHFFLRCVVIVTLESATNHTTLSPGFQERGFLFAPSHFAFPSGPVPVVHWSVPYRKCIPGPASHCFSPLPRPLPICNLHFSICNLFLLFNVPSHATKNIRFPTTLLNAPATASTWSSCGAFGNILSSSTNAEFQLPRSSHTLPASH